MARARLAALANRQCRLFTGTAVQLIIESPEAVLTFMREDRSFRTSKLSLRKEVIQPQVPLRLPCYDLVPVTEPSVGTAVSRQLRLFPAPMT
jgi:hypothetical protein